MASPTEPDEATKATELADASRDHTADGTGTERHVAVADEALSGDDSELRRDVAAHEEEMLEIGAHVKGEGEVK